MEIYHVISEVPGKTQKNNIVIQYVYNISYGKYLWSECHRIYSNIIFEMIAKKTIYGIPQHGQQYRDIYIIIYIYMYIYINIYIALGQVVKREYDGIEPQFLVFSCGYCMLL